jgi:hypothetical protein
MQIKPIMRRHFTPGRMTVYPKDKKINKSWQGRGESGTHTMLGVNYYSHYGKQ